MKVMKQTLRNLFKNYGTVLDVVAHRNIRMRGQAFVSFDSAESAYKALREVKGFPLYAKPIVCFRISAEGSVTQLLTHTSLFDLLFNSKYHSQNQDRMLLSRTLLLIRSINTRLRG